MAEQIYVGDEGTSVGLTIYDDSGSVVDVSTSSTRDVVVVKPDGSSIVKSASITTDGKDGKIHFVSVSGDFDMPGLYRVQGVIAFPNGKWHTTVHEFHVAESLS